MSARELAEPYPSVSTDDDATDAARLLAEHKLPALLVVDRDGQPYAIVPGSQLIAQLLPEFVLEDPLFAAVIDDRELDEVPGKLAGLTVAEWLPRRRFRPPTVGPDASVMHIAALMARTHTPLVAVVERDGDQPRLAGAVTAARLMERLVGGS
ncbi:CBS domain-containing protein [Streptomyces luteolifulvus]|uniref:CBS domain-containing protein n=1 Tax=Streptomyces luteolifulvus TaxID=2615112 RepID=A0A6H9V9C2_9ACTN|nr:CBS domain-containing protein [Streptomyces luteolifulvus]KAB1150138.1 CBS domain-containing protein [Streptomyces luteolifulvus]